MRSGSTSPIGHLLEHLLDVAGPMAPAGAHQAHPLAAVQCEYSLWTRDPERGLLPVLRELGAEFVPWSPIGAGFFAGSLERPGEDFRSNHPRFNASNPAADCDRHAPLRGPAAERQITPTQLALAGRRHRPDPGHAHAGAPRPEPRRRRDLDPATLARIVELAPAGSALL